MKIINLLIIELCNRRTRNIWGQLKEKSNTCHSTGDKAVATGAEGADGV